MNDTNSAFSSALPSCFGLEFAYSDPKAILSAAELSIGDKREILSSWASDARAVADAPALRRLDNGKTVAIQDIFDALKKLDVAERETGYSKLTAFRPRVRTQSHWVPTMLRRRRRDDDDDPPPCPAVIAPAPLLPTLGATNQLEAA